MKPLCWILLVFSVPVVASAVVPAVSSKVGGKVFVDANGNGQPDDGEKPLAGVRVTDGVGFAVSAADGTYQLTMAADAVVPYQPARTVSVSWPDGYWPSGRWWWRGDEIANPEQVHFALREDKRGGVFSFGHVSDDHGSLVGGKDNYAATFNGMAGVLRFVVNTGDTSTAQENGHLTFKPLAEAEALCKIPMFNTAGNHDFGGPPAADATKPEEFSAWGPWTKHMGPLRWSFTHGGVHFVGIDCINGKELEVPEVAVRWLDDDLTAQPAGARKLLFVHFPSGERLVKVLEKHAVPFVFGGHTHSAQYIPVGTSVCFQTPPSGVSVTTVTPDAIYFGEQDMPWASRYWYGSSGLTYYEKHLRPAMERRRGQAHVVSPQALKDGVVSVQAGEASSVEVLAAFERGQSRRVGLRIGASKPLELAFSERALEINGAPVPLASLGGTKTVYWHILADSDTVTLVQQETANDGTRGQARLRVPIPRGVDRPSVVTAFAEGGEGRVSQLEVWELKPLNDPEVRRICHYPPVNWHWAGDALIQKMSGGAPRPPDK